MKPQARTIYNALMRGEVLTNQMAVKLYGVEALSQRCGEISRDASVPEVVSSERVNGKPHNKHWIQGAIKNATKQADKPIVVASHTRKSRKPFEDHPEFDW